MVFYAYGQLSMGRVVLANLVHGERWAGGWETRAFLWRSGAGEVVRS